jgi:hypothetical protein
LSHTLSLFTYFSLFYILLENTEISHCLPFMEILVDLIA